MKIRFERSGGFAGRTTNVEIDASSLPEAERQTLTSLVTASGFFTLPSGPDKTPPTGADRYNYRITVETAGGTHTIETSEETAPESLTPLLAWLNDASRRRPTSSSPR